MILRASVPLRRFWQNRQESGFVQLEISHILVEIGARCGLNPDAAAGKAIMDRIRREHDAAVALALGARGGTSLLDNNPDLLSSVELARQVIAPMNHLQLELLSRRRAGDEDEQVRLGLQLTVAGIAAGLRNTG